MTRRYRQATIVSQLAFASLLLFSSRGYAQYTSANTSFWIEENGAKWNVASNWNLREGKTTVPQSNPPSHALFSSSAGGTMEVEVGLHPTEGRPPIGTQMINNDVVIEQGMWNFDLNGVLFSFGKLVIGTANTDTSTATDISFTNSNPDATANLQLKQLVFQSSGQTYQLAGLHENLNGRVGSNITLTFLTTTGNGVFLGGNGGINNTFVLNAGETSNVGPINLEVGRTDGASNNRLVVDGGTLTATLIDAKGFYSDSGGSVIASNNNVEVKNGGSLSTGSRSATIGAGNRMTIESGGTFTGALMIEQHARLEVSGAGSRLNVLGGGISGSTVNGSASFGNGTVFSAAQFDVGATGEVVFDGVVSEGQSTNFTINGGEMQILNSDFRASDGTERGSFMVYGGKLLIQDSFFTGTRLNSVSEGAGGLNVHDEGEVTISNSTVSLAGSLETSGRLGRTAGKSISIENGSRVNAYSVASGIYGEKISVSADSRLYVERLISSSYNVQGRVHVKRFEAGSSVGRIEIGKDMTVVLEGGNYDLEGTSGSGTNQPGQFTVVGGLEGSGAVGKGGTHSTTITYLNGATVNPGQVNDEGVLEVGMLEFADVRFEEDATTRLVFDLLDVWEYDQLMIDKHNKWGDIELVINLHEDRFWTSLDKTDVGCAIAMGLI